MSKGIKFDGEKPRYDLVPAKALADVVDVLTYGAQKYEPDNWLYVPEWERRYFAAAQRHIWAWKQGESVDSETGINHLAHAICCLMFMIEREANEIEGSER